MQPKWNVVFEKEGTLYFSINFYYFSWNWPRLITFTLYRESYLNFDPLEKWNLEISATEILNTFYANVTSTSFRHFILLNVFQFFFMQKISTIPDFSHHISPNLLKWVFGLSFLFSLRIFSFFQKTIYGNRLNF